MKLSICIPVYNTDMRPLVEELLVQIQRCDEPMELFLLDDGSNQKFRDLNQTLAQQCRYEELPENVGRAAIRNTLAARAKGEFLLFLDGDVRMAHKDFVVRYLAKITFEYEPAVYVGGRVYGSKPKNHQHLLRWKYGVYRESKAASSRQEDPYGHFMTNNFVIPAKLFETIQFDEQLRGYGHEDTWFGLELAQQGVKIIHFENPVLNGDLDDAQTFLDHTKEALINLDVLSRNHPGDERVKKIKAIRLLDAIGPFRGMFKLLLWLLKPWWENNLRTAFPSLKAFDCFRLYWAIKIMGKN